MRKKQLIEQNTVLYNKVQDLFVRNKKLENEIQSLKQNMRTDDSVKKSDTVATTGEKNVSPNLKFADVPVDENIDYGSKVIGKIVLESTKAADKLSTESNSQDKRELINLVLGRTEVAKAEILKITSSNLTDEGKKTEIDKEYSETVEYINSVLAQ